MPSSRIPGATARCRWRSGSSGSWRTRQARGPERRSRSGLVSFRPPNVQAWPEPPAHARRLKPPAYAGLVRAIGLAEPPFQVRLLARNDAVADRDRQRQGEDQGPRAARGHAQAPVDEKQAEVDGIAAPRVNAGRDQRTRGLVRGHRRRRPGEAPHTRGGERKTDEDETAGDRPGHRICARDRERQGQQTICDEAEEKTSEKENWRSRYDARGRAVVHVV